MFKSNNINYRFKKGNTTQIKSKKNKLKKNNTVVNKNNKKKEKMTFKELRFNKLVEEKKKQKKLESLSKMEFTNNFLEDTCGSDLFLLKKLPKLYDPKKENEILYKFKNLDEDIFKKTIHYNCIQQSLRFIFNKIT